ncbi:C-GCAxxG-C-C family (seleno)protein [Cetobacterium sp.]|uniref:C-GCAxxG-C-C family (seleno)protein n=1 Tax=Cetobacterium sp. TaxID=2071632 RepID=UPI002FC93591
MLRKITRIFRKDKAVEIVDGEVNIKALREKAENYYKNRDFYCSEAVLKTLKDAFDAPYGDDIVKLASGFPVGMGNGCTCGAVNGGVMAIGMFFGRGKAGGTEVKKSMELTKELQLEFTKKRKVCCCKVLTKGMELGSKSHINHCVEITGELTEMTAKILARELGYKEKK